MSALAYWCYSHRRLVLFGWLLALVGLGAGALGVGAGFTDTTELPAGEATTAYALIEQAAGLSTGPATTAGKIAWHTDGTAIDDPSVIAETEAMLDQISTMPGVESVVSPYSETGAMQINSNENTAFATVALTADADNATIEAAADQFEGTDLSVAFGGTAFTELPSPSNGTEAVGVIAALAILFLVFRSRWAAVLPIITGVVGVAASLLIVVLASNFVSLSATSLTMGALIGLGVGIDYALFIVNRFRKALMQGRSVPDAIKQSIDTSGRAVIFAGLTVIVALLGMFVVQLSLLTGMAQAAAVTVLFTVATALTLLPALLGMIGYKALSKKQIAQLTGQVEAPLDTKLTMGTRWSVFIQRFPRSVVAVTLALIVVLAAPVLSMRVGNSDVSSDPVGSNGREYFEMMSPAFGEGIDATLVLVAETPDAAAVDAFNLLVADLPGTEGIAAVSAVPAVEGQPIAMAAVIPTTSAQTAETQDLVHNLRDNVIPAGTSGSTLAVYVGGETASNIDISDALMSKLPLYLVLVAVLGFLLLAVAFRSILVPLVGALSNLMTIMVGLGAITAIFQFGWGSALLGVGSGAPLMFIVPVIIVGVIFGLSMDYQVFLVSRIREEWTLTKDNSRSVKVGVADTAKVIATAATIMLCVFASFGFSGERIVSGIGIGLALAVIVDAFVIRLSLIPALMHLLGRSNWWYPRWAERLTPNFSIEGSPDIEELAPVAEGLRSAKHADIVSAS